MKTAKIAMGVIAFVVIVGFVLPYMISSKHTELVILAIIGCIAAGAYIVNFLTNNFFKIHEFLTRE